MKTKILLSTLAALVLASAPAAAAGDALAKPITVATGDLVAQDIANLLDAMRASDAAVVHYDRATKKIEIRILGTKGTLDAAKREVDDFFARFFDPITYRVEEIYGVKLEDSDFRIRYLNRAADYREMVRRENGKYFIPE